jgi:fumarylpyruvate hydrolase
MIKSLVFNLPRPSVPIFVRSSTRTAALANDGDGEDSTSSNGRNGVESGSSASSSFVNSNLEFPIRRIYCVGRNYRDHAIEMGGNPEREAPFFFQKPSDAIRVCYRDDNTTASEISTTTIIPYPTMTTSLHYEGEFIIAIGKDGSRIPTNQAMHHIYGYAIGCDLTRRDLQNEAKKSGKPWDAAKGFDSSCPISPIIPKEEILPLLSLDHNGDINDYELTLKVNNTIRQQSTLGNMIYSTSEIISNLSKLYRLRQGDIILTGTPAGVSQLNIGDVVSITCGDLIPCEFVIGAPE